MMMMIGGGDPSHRNDNNKDTANDSNKHKATNTNIHAGPDETSRGDATIEGNNFVFR